MGRILPDWQRLRQLRTSREGRIGTIVTIVGIIWNLFSPALKFCRLLVNAVNEIVTSYEILGWIQAGAAWIHNHSPSWINSSSMSSFLTLGGAALVWHSLRTPTETPAQPIELVSAPNLPAIVGTPNISQPIEPTIDLPPLPNIVALRAEFEFIPDPHSFDSADKAFVAYFHNEPRQDAKIGTAFSVTATISYKFGVDTEQKVMVEFARSIKAPWIISGGFQTNHVGFESNSIRQLILGVEGAPGHFFALENMGDEAGDKNKKKSGEYDYTHRIPLADMSVEAASRYLACVRFTIDGRIDSKEYRFVLNLSKNPSCSREEDEIPF